MKQRWISLIAVTLMCGVAQAAYVIIGDAGNTADTTGYGAVGYSYKISTHEVTIAEFQTAVDDDSRIAATRPSGSGSYPVKGVSWKEALRYCNWLTTGNAYSGAYQFNDAGVPTGVMTREEILADGGTFYVLPTENEWYKAAFYTGNAADLWSLYANGTDTAPSAGTAANYSDAVGATWLVGTAPMEQNATYDMMGNVWEWLEDAEDGVHDDPNNEIHLMRGGAYDDNAISLASSTGHAYPAITASYDLGFRVVAVPEPASALMILVGGTLIGLVRRFYGRA